MFREPMLATKGTALPTGGQWLMEPKYDGWRAILSITTDSVRIYTRTGNEITQVPYIADPFGERLPAGTILDGEIVDLSSGGPQWNRTQTILSTTRGGYRHTPSDTDPPLSYVVFDVLQIDGEDVCRQPLLVRKRRLVELLEGAEAWLGCDIRHSPVHPPTDEGLEALLALGFEGVVVKDTGSTYRCGGRGRGWVKIKPQDEVEARVIGTYPPEPGSKYAPLDKDGKPQAWAVGGICFRVEHADGTSYDGRAAGMDDQLRRELHAEPEKFIGLTVELAHWGIQPQTGALRHPNFRRFRSSSEKGTPASNPVAGTPGSPVVSTNGTEKRRMRNYAAMNDAKLLRCIQSLRDGSGEAFDRCLSAGSGNPAADLKRAEELARAKQLI